MQALQEPERNSVTRVMIVDDHRVLAELLTAALSTGDEVAVVESVGTAREAIARVGAVRPDVVVLDYDLPDTDGVTAMGALKSACPSCRILMLTSYTDPVILNEAFDAGCDGFVTKRNGAADILSAVVAVAANETPVSPDMVRSLVGRANGAIGSDLTERELDVLRIAALGHSNKDIAAELFLSVNTVRNHMQHILHKLGAHSKLEATSIAVRAGILRR